MAVAVRVNGDSTSLPLPGLVTVRDATAGVTARRDKQKTDAHFPVKRLKPEVTTELPAVFCKLSPAALRSIRFTR